MKQRKVWLHQTNDNELALFVYTGKPSRRLRQLMCAYVTGRGLTKLLTSRRILSREKK